MGPLFREMVYSPSLPPSLWYAEAMVQVHILDHWDICHVLDAFALHPRGHSMVNIFKKYFSQSDPPSRPLNYFWLQYSPAGMQGLVKGRCTLSVDVPKQAFCALNSLADFALLIVPAAAIGKLKMNLNRKIGLIAIFLIGTL